MAFYTNIDDESSANVSSPSDIDNFRYRYVDIDNDRNLSVIFPGFEISTLERNLYLLLSNSELVDWRQSWKFRPDYTSYDYYGTVTYWYIILYVNQIDSIEDFDGIRKVIIPSIRTVKNLASDRIFYYEKSSEDSYYFESKFYKRYPLDSNEGERIQSKEYFDDDSSTIEQECVLKEVKEIFTLTDEDIFNKYVDIKYQPANFTSIQFQIEGYASLSSYGYDYILKYGTCASEMKRISWCAGDCIYGNGLDNILQSEDIINITYLYPENGCDQCQPANDDILDGGIYGYETVPIITEVENFDEVTCDTQIVDLGTF